MPREAEKAPALPDIPAPAALGTGILPCQALKGLVARRALDAGPPAAPERIQPTGIDLRLGVTIMGLRCSTRHALPGGGPEAENERAGRVSPPGPHFMPSEGFVNGWPSIPGQSHLKF